MPAPHPPEFRQRAVEFAREREKPIEHIARDLGISESGLRNWMAQADVDEGKREGLTITEREELRKLRSEQRVEDGERDLQAGRAYFARENVCPARVTFRLVRDRRRRQLRRGGLPGVRVSTSGYYEWRAGRPRPGTPTGLPGEHDPRHPPRVEPVHGAPRVHAELRLGTGSGSAASGSRGCCAPGLGADRPPQQAALAKRPAEAVHEDLVQPAGSSPLDRTCCGAPTSPSTPPAREGLLAARCSTCYTRQVVGWSIADHMRSDLVVDALQMATWRRRPEPGTIVHADRGSQYTSGSSGTGCARPACSDPWAASRPRWTTR